MTLSSLLNGARWPLRVISHNTAAFGAKFVQELIMDEIPERDVTYHLTCLLIYHGTTTHLYSCFIFF